MAAAAPAKSVPMTWAEGFAASFKAKLEAGDAAGVASLYADDAILSLDGANHAGKAAIGGHWASIMGGRGIILKVAQVSGIGADLTGGARVVAVCLTGEWAPAGAATAQRFASVFTLLPPAAAGAQPLVKNHIHRASTADSQAPNVPPSHAPIQDFVGKFIGAFDGAASGEARAAALGFAYADGVSMTFEQDEFAGKEAALRKLASLPAGKHKPCTVDVHPITASASVAFVTGQLVLEEHPMFYVQAIFLAATPAGSQAPYIIVGDMFQFNYA